MSKSVEQDTTAEEPAYTDAAESGQRSGKGNGFLYSLLFGSN